MWRHGGHDRCDVTVPTTVVASRWPRPRQRPSRSSPARRRVNSESGLIMACWLSAAWHGGRPLQALSCPGKVSGPHFDSYLGYCGPRRPQRPTAALRLTRLAPAGSSAPSGPAPATEPAVGANVCPARRPTLGLKASRMARALACICGRWQSRTHGRWPPTDPCLVSPCMADGRAARLNGPGPTAALRPGMNLPQCPP